MKTTIKQIFCIILAAFMLGSFSALANTIYAPIDFGSSGWNSHITMSNRTNNPYEVTASNSISERIKLSSDALAIKSVTVLSPSYSDNKGSITLAVYPWSGNLSASFSSGAIGKKTFTDYADNSYLTLDIPNNTYSEIVVNLSEGSGGVGVWVPTIFTLPAGVSSQSVYKNYSLVSGCLCIEFDVGKASGSASTRNPYNLTDPGNADDISVFQKQYADDHMAPYTGYWMLNHSVSGPAYAAYYNMDFGTTSPKGFQIRYYIMESANWNNLQIRLDSPTGKIIGDMKFTHDDTDPGLYWGDNHFWTLMTCKLLEPVTGVHDVYLVEREGNSPCGILGKFKFTKEDVADSMWEKERKSFVPVSDDTLTDTKSDTWVATDELGRKLPDYSAVGGKRDGKDVMLFYWTFTSLSAYKGTKNMNVQKIIDAYPGPESDIKNNYNFVGWGGQAFWNESIYGYYTSYDTWVMHKQLELLSAAGVDCLATDCSNGNSTFATGYIRLVREMHKMRQNGYNVPKITFLLPWQKGTSTRYDIENLYIGMYGAGLYSDCWYYKDGKPLLLGYGTSLDGSSGNSEIDSFRSEVKSFFNYRPVQWAYKFGQTESNQWAWLEVYPQHEFNKTSSGCELVTVGVSQNSRDSAQSYCAMNADGVYGRSYTYKDRFSKMSDHSVLYGYNFQEQWDRALSLDPETIFITGWNEWSVARSEKDGDGTRNAMVDEYNDEYSRDIEPSRGQLGDNYYMQMCANIRKFKGVSPTPVASAPKSVSVNGSFSQWDDVTPEYIGYKGGTEHRNQNGFGHSYVNNTGRNDIVLSKVARDSDNICFYVKTEKNLTAYSGRNWMRLYVNSDRSFKTGWEGYDYIINRESPVAMQAMVEKHVGDKGAWKWEKVGVADMKMSGSELMLSLPKSLMNLGNDIDIEFKWHDGGVNDGDVQDFYVNGDAAPVGRFNYRYVTNLARGVQTADEPINPATDPALLSRKMIVMYSDSPYAYANGRRTPIDPDNGSIAPLIINNKAMVPVRFITENLGGTAEWNDSSKTATLTLLGRQIVLTEGGEYMQTPGGSVKLQTPAQNIEGRIFIPLRDVTEGFGLDCNWSGGTITVGKGANALCTANPSLAQGMKNLLK